MDFKKIRAFLLRAFIGFLGLTALVAIVCLLSGEFGDVQMKILATTFTISAASICSMSCAAFIEKRKSIKLGLSGIALSVAAAALAIIGMWPEIQSDAFWKTAATLGVLAIAFAHAFLLVLPDLDRSHKWLQPVSSASIGVLALQIIIAVWCEIDEEGYYRLLGVVAIIVTLETLVVPILMRLKKKAAQIAERLVLERLDGDLYRDAAGNRYRVKALGTGGEPGGDPKTDANPDGDPGR